MLQEELAAASSASASSEAKSGCSSGAAAPPRTTASSESARRHALLSFVLFVPMPIALRPRKGPSGTSTKLKWSLGISRWNCEKCAEHSRSSCSRPALHSKTLQAMSAERRASTHFSSMHLTARKCCSWYGTRSTMQPSCSRLTAVGSCEGMLGASSGEADGGPSSPDLAPESWNHFQDAVPAHCKEEACCSMSSKCSRRVCQSHKHHIKLPEV
mmetsp:Transcript_106704/g.311922  ORF Transcript_106704/g.311922 Transcript_106704/m.311922 type:complete len:214 (+) Transcript_106704:415-1056(+)